MEYSSAAKKQKHIPGLATHRQKILVQKKKEKSRNKSQKAEPQRTGAHSENSKFKEKRDQAAEIVRR